MKKLLAVLKYIAFLALIVYMASAALSGILMSKMNSLSFAYTGDNGTEYIICDFVNDVRICGADAEASALENETAVKIAGSLLLFPYWKSDYTKNGNTVTWDFIRSYESIDTYVYGTDSKKPLFFGIIADLIKGN